MSGKVISFIKKKMEKDYILPVKRLRDSLGGLVTSSGENDDYFSIGYVLYLSLNEFLEKVSDIWVALLYYRTNESDIIYSTALEDIDSDFLSFIPYSGPPLTRSSIWTTKDFIDLMPYKYKTLNSGYLMLIIPIFELFNRVQGMLLRVEVRDDFSISRFYFQTTDQEIYVMTIDLEALLLVTEVVKNLNKSVNKEQEHNG